MRRTIAFAVIFALGFSIAGAQNKNQNSQGQQQPPPAEKKEEPKKEQDPAKPGEEPAKPAEPKEKTAKFDDAFYNERLARIDEVAKAADIIFVGEVKELGGAPEYWNMGKRIPNVVHYNVVDPLKGFKQTPKEEAPKEPGKKTDIKPDEKSTKEKEKGKTEIDLEKSPVVKVVHVVSTDIKPNDPRSRVNPTTLSPGTKVIILAVKEGENFVTNDIEVSIIPYSAANADALRAVLKKYGKGIEAPPKAP